METQMSRGGVLVSLVLTLSMLLAPGSTSEQDLPAKVPQSGKTVAEKQLRKMGHVLARIEGLAYRINLLGGQRYEVFIFGIDKWEIYGKSAAPVKVVYEFYRDEPNLPEKFFDFSSRYKPDAANPHVRFDERGVETEHGGVSEAPTDRAGKAWKWGN